MIKLQETLIKRVIKQISEPITPISNKTDVLKMDVIQRNRINNTITALQPIITVIGSSENPILFVTSGEIISFGHAITYKSFTVTLELPDGYRL